MVKKLPFLLFLFALIAFPKNVFADNDFVVDAEIEYVISESGKGSVENSITIENMTSERYAASYTLHLESIDAKEAYAFEDEKKLKFRQESENGSTALIVHFENPAVGFGNKKTFNITYSVDNLAARTGEVWEISIPRLSNPGAFRSYSVILSVPLSFGEEAYISPEARSLSTKDGQRVYFFNRDDISETGITAGFGKFQVFSFSLSYHLENPLSKSAIVEIALPPDTSYQKLYYQRIEPAPSDVVVDDDGNWLATYTLKPRERIDVNAAGSVQILARPRTFPSPSKKTLENNLAATSYWQADDEQIKILSNKLASPRAIYDYITKNLRYDFERVRPNVVRKGAKEALATPDSAICMEFTDSFVALARAAGIPAREINGFAYTENPEIQPLSLVADVLHSWPEYWDEDSGVWVPVDPTWGATSKVDYFEKLDLRHFAFVIHGVDPTTPYPAGSYKLGANPQKDVFVNFGYLPTTKKSEPEISTATQMRFPWASREVIIKIKNPGPTAYYSLTPKILFDGKVVKTGFSRVLTPYAEFAMQATIPYGFLGFKIPSDVKIQVDGKEVLIPSYRKQSIIFNLILLSSTLAFIAISLLIKYGKLKKIIKNKLRQKKT